MRKLTLALAVTLAAFTHAAVAQTAPEDSEAGAIRAAAPDYIEGRGR